MIRHENVDAMVLASTRVIGIHPLGVRILNIRGVNAFHKCPG
jgi:hypothetical protein